jgi:hypothetical protein
MVQSSHILEPVFDLHNHVKKAVLERLLDTAKVCYTENPNMKLNYILDDFSRKMLTVDANLLDNSTYGIFVSNSSKAHEIKEVISQLSHAAMQSQKVDLSDVIKVMRADGVQEAEEMLMASEARKREEMQQQQMQQLQKQQEMQQEAFAHEKEMKMFDRETEMMKEKMKTDREIQSQTIMSLGFNQDKDVDKDGKLDVLEVAKQGVDVDVKQRRQKLDEEKFNHQKEMDKKKAELDSKKLNKK